MKVVEETFRQLLQMVWCLSLEWIFVYIDEDFEINWIRPKLHAGGSDFRLYDGSGLKTYLLMRW